MGIITRQSVCYFTTLHRVGGRYLIYPDGRSSIRMERLTEGAQVFEKVRILKEEFAKKGDKGAIEKIDRALQMFDERKLGEVPAATAVNKAKEIINRYY